MEILNNLLLGFSVAMSMENLLWCFAGVFLGTFVGVLPGLGPMSAISILLPFTLTLNDPIASIIFMAGIYYGTQYGASTSSILLNLPGDSATVVTTLDGYAMTKNGRAGSALAISAGASFIAGTISTVLIMLVAQPLSEIAFWFGSPEYAGLMLLGMLASVALTQGSYLSGLGMVLLGVLLGLVGTDINTASLRFTMGITELSDGMSFGIIAMGVFGIGEIFYNILHQPKLKPLVPRMSELYPTQEEIKQSMFPALRGSFVGTLFGLLPGGGATISSFASYALEKSISKESEKFGQGHPAGVAGPEAANNAGAQSSFIPMLSLGIPITPIMALIVAVLMVNGIQPGPQVINNNPALFWGFIASLWIGNLFLLILNLPLIGLWVKVLKMPWSLLYPLIIVVCIFGAYSINNSVFDVALVLLFGVVGYVLKVLGTETAPLALGFIVGPLFEEHFRRSLNLSQGEWSIFFHSSISTVLFVSCLISVIFGIFFKARLKKI
jgi:TctA family transporter